MAGPIWTKLIKRIRPRDIDSEPQKIIPDSDSEADIEVEDQRLCLRCTELDVLQLIEDLEQENCPPYSWWYEQNSDNRHNPVALIDAVPYRELGQRSAIKFEKACPLCQLLCPVVEDGDFDAQDELFLLPAWGIERIEQSISLWWRNYKQQHQGRQRSRRYRCLPEAVRWMRHVKSHKTERLPMQNLNYSKILYIAMQPRRKSKTGVQETFTFPHESFNAIGVVQDKHDSPVMAGRAVKDKVNFDIVTRWINQCGIHHGISCKPRPAESLESMRLIDVHTRVIVPYKEGIEYICLSYVWGDIKQETYRLGETLRKLPNTFEDAITVVKALGKRYLWVDSVCIEQHNNPHKEDQIRKMDCIYAGAWITIVALNGDSANSGLGRISSNTPQIPQASCTLKWASMVSLFPTLQQQINRSKWGKRAWTLQEGQLSPRCLYFTPHQVYFECRSIQCCESVQDSHTPFHSWSNKRRLISRYDKTPQTCLGPGVFLDQSSATDSQTWTDSQLLTIYDHYVREYCSRELSYEADTIKAITPLFEDLQRTHSIFKGGFFWGLPVDALPFALLWFCSGQQQRREGFPSWSWAGWRGQLERIVDHVKTIQEGPHEANEDGNTREYKKQASYFVEFKQGREESQQPFVVLYQGIPRDKDPALDQDEWNSKYTITNSFYVHYLDGNFKSMESYNQLLFVKGFIFRVKVSCLNSGQGVLPPQEENEYKFTVNEITCKIACPNQATLQELLKLDGPTKYLLVLHREFVQSHWCYDLLLLNWNQDVAYRVSPLKLSFPAADRLEEGQSLPNWAYLHPETLLQDRWYRLMAKYSKTKLRYLSDQVIRFSKEGSPSGKYIAPSWSWASTNTEIDFSFGHSERNFPRHIFAGVINANASTITPNPTSQVSDGWLDICGVIENFNADIRICEPNCSCFENEDDGHLCSHGSVNVLFTPLFPDFRIKSVEFDRLLDKVLISKPLITNFTCLRMGKGQTSWWGSGWSEAVSVDYMILEPTANADE
ncbi:hypothetical protein G7Y89_g2460 [Cudoniella acicularis]|uniref:Heterokaryon incompatibility domain-containing protein n=1 Tax=Cudoniella acicularis TaxID=354080 RepID=A0A8H4RT92_9HELO|nr:hypothetical protein G7Y89_g2460 [Cudoniella acicularis]